MEIELVEINELSGKKARFYSIYIDDEQKSLFDQFLEEYYKTHPKEIDDILLRLKAMNEETGIREHFFNRNEGRADDGIVAFYDLPSKNLRLYCILYGKVAVVLGGGGVKPKTIRTYQEAPLLYNQVKVLQQVERLINQNIRSKDLVLEENGFSPLGTILNDYEN